MSAQKKERDNKKAREDSEKKRGVSITKSVIANTKIRGRFRDFGTQIRYKGDGKNLSLMEIDIL